MAPCITSNEASPSTHEHTPPDAAATDGVQALRIALLGYRSNPFSGGQGIYIRYMARALADLGHQVEVISGEPYPDLDPDITLTKLPGLNLFQNMPPQTPFRLRYLSRPTELFEWASVLSGGFPEPYTFGRRVYDYLATRREDFDLVHDNQTLSYGVAKIPALGLPLVTTIHHPITFDRDIALQHSESRTQRWLIRRWHHFLAMQTKVARSLEHIVTVSASSQQDIAASFGVDTSRIRVIYNGVDTELFAPHRDIEREDDLLITTASADQPLKGTQHLIPAFAKLRERHPQLRLIFIGKPKPDGKVAELITQFDLARHIEFRHGISTEAIVELYARATVAVVPSEYEGFGLPAAEAMACEVPLVSSDGGALPEVVGNAGIVVPAANVDALATAISTMLNDPATRSRLGKAGRARMLERFSWSHAATTLTDYYNEILAAQKQTVANKSTYTTTGTADTTQQAGVR